MEKTINFLKENIQNNQTLVVATSGGPDSMCLLSLLCNIKESKNLKLICAHVNHKVRIESDKEALMVEEFCKKNNVVFELYEITEFQTQNFTEEQAHYKRYNFFKSLIKKYHASYLLTAHHGDDLIETILMRITRGSTLSGYKGIPLISKNPNYEIIRPLLLVTKEDILKYVKDNNIPYATDVTNSNLLYTRNRYRHNILPHLKSENKQVHLKYLKFSEELTSYEEFVSNYIKSKNIIVNNYIDIKKLQNESDFIKRKSIELLIKEIQKDNIFDVTDKNMQDLLNLLNNPNKSINLKCNYIGINSYNTLKIIKKENKEFTSIIFDKDITTDYFNFYYNSKEFDNTNNCIALLSSEIKFPLILRKRRNGDKINVKNLGNKKVKEIFINSKITREIRDNYPILVDQDNNILWIPGIKKSQFSKDNKEKYDIIIKCEGRRKNLYE